MSINVKFSFHKKHAFFLSVDSNEKLPIHVSFVVSNYRFVLILKSDCIKLEYTRNRLPPTIRFFPSRRIDEANYCSVLTQSKSFLAFDSESINIFLRGNRKIKNRTRY